MQGLGCGASATFGNGDGATALRLDVVESWDDLVAWLRRTLG